MTATIRRADYGVTDLEFSLGARIFCNETGYLQQNGYLVLDSEQWKQHLDMMSGCPEDGDQKDFFVNTSYVRDDKWNKKLPFVDGCVNYGSESVGGMTKKI